ncbi:glycosyltransferase family 4 protein [Calothrix sp. PCC 7507]|uniref:glycosyltransferase family 4 protein n=1 Tax=Calothrix sp. PCC 7507 TaxID=99598 RepID=UPI00029F0CD7|nr:glycosyltransferase family 4 protein [Calothrix sp. PCC 7507]AFY30869.1 glycosyl transferase group 1 [Calothrix sp. PCC 7507]
MSYFNNKTIKVFIVCSGLGHVKRGFESFTQECFDALSSSPELDVTLFKGGGKSTPNQISLGNFPRESPLGIHLGKLTGRGSYFIEQTSFSCSLIPHIYQQQPDVIYFSDGAIGNFLWHWRKLTGQPYKLLFSNGGPLSPPFHRWDHVQQVVPIHLQAAVEVGEPLEKQSLVSYGINIYSQFKILTVAEKASLKRKLELPNDLPIILSVGAINKSHKRMDYLIREVAQLPKPHPYLLILGQMEAESPEVLELGNKLLEPDKFQIRTVAAHEVADYYQVSDAFVLASLGEGFGRVFLEAMSYGLPCLAHDYEVTRFVLKEEGYLANFQLPGSLTSLISQALSQNDDISKYRRHQLVYEYFSWDSLRSSYVSMIHRCAVNNLATADQEKLNSSL